MTIKSKNLQVIIIIATLGKCLELPTSQADPRWRGQGHLKRNLRAGERTPSRGMHTPLDINYDDKATCWSPLKMKHDRICIQSKAFHFFRYFAPLCCTLGWQTGQVGRRRSEGRGVALAHSGLGGPQPHRSFFNPFHQSDTFM